MANNMTVGPNFVVAAEDQVLSSASEITAQNTAVIINEDFQSFKPGRSSNGLEELVAGEGYYFYMLQAAEFPFLIPPLPTDPGSPAGVFSSQFSNQFS